MDEHSIEIAKKFGRDLPEKVSEYPAVLYKWFLDLNERISSQKKLALDVPASLALIAEGVFVSGLQMSYENEMRTKALGVIMRDRLVRAKEANKWLSGSNSTQQSYIQQI